MRNIEPNDFNYLREVIYLEDINHILLSKSWIEEKNGKVLAALVIDNRWLPCKNTIPWNNQAKEIIDRYMVNYKDFTTYHISLMCDNTQTGILSNMYSEFLKSIHVGDHIWVNVLKESDAYHIMEFGGFVRLSSEIYLTQYVP